MVELKYYLASLGQFTQDKRVICEIRLSVWGDRHLTQFISAYLFFIKVLKPKLLSSNFECFFKIVTRLAVIFCQ